MRHGSYAPKANCNLNSHSQPNYDLCRCGNGRIGHFASRPIVCLNPERDYYDIMTTQRCLLPADGRVQALGHRTYRVRHRGLSTACNHLQACCHERPLLAICPQNRPDCYRFMTVNWRAFHSGGSRYFRNRQIFRYLVSKNTVRGARAARCDTLTENRAQNTVKNTVELYCYESAFHMDDTGFNELPLVDDAEFMVSGAQNN